MDHILLPSLRQFWKLYGNTDVPYQFVVPEGDDAWPKLAWGRRLGLTAAAMRAGKAYASELKEELERLRFFSTTVYERDWTEKILPSFKTHQQEFGHCLVRLDFKVLSCHPWSTMA
ncbi:hypothetical protein JG687_00015109 [Phytophthora cactorum]|uniref:Uncharacterized protein n=1 Tax=Phytophthora cactorum TaxID=29920 RepID=A0A8T1TUL6_9STRA|nr:hypothetical protein JG687_00015109 [Phytophthora cactorum]